MAKMLEFVINFFIFASSFSIELIRDCDDDVTEEELNYISCPTFKERDNFLSFTHVLVAYEGNNSILDGSPALKIFGLYEFKGYGQADGAVESGSVVYKHHHLVGSSYIYKNNKNNAWLDTWDKWVGSYDLTGDREPWIASGNCTERYVEKCRGPWKIKNKHDLWISSENISITGVTTTTKTIPTATKRMSTDTMDTDRYSSPFSARYSTANATTTNLCPPFSLPDPYFLLKSLGLFILLKFVMFVQ